MEIPNVFVNPNTGNPLIQDDSCKNFIDSATDKRFPIYDHLIQLLPHQDTAYREHYEHDAEAFDYFSRFEPVHEAENLRLRQYILEKAVVQKPSDLRILDVGCGRAWVAKHFQHSAATVFSMDISTINPERALKKYPFEKHFGVIADVMALPFGENTLDLIIASEIIEHVPDPKQFVEKLFKALKPGGRLIISTPYNEKIQYSLCIHCNQLTPHNAHLHSFNLNNIDRLLPDKAQKEIDLVNNKILTLTKLICKIKNLPFPLYKRIDRLASFIFRNKQQRLVIAIVK